MQFTGHLSRDERRLRTGSVRDSSKAGRTIQCAHKGRPNA